MHPRWGAVPPSGVVDGAEETWDRGPIVEQDAVDGLVRPRYAWITYSPGVTFGNSKRPSR